MNINVKATGTTLTPAINSYVDKKIGGLHKFVNKDPDAVAHVEIQVTTHHHHDSHDHFRAEVNFHAGATHIRAEATDHDLYAAIDAVRDEVYRQLVSDKTRRISMIRRGGQRIKDMLRGWKGGDQQ